MITLYYREKRVISGCSAKNVSRGRGQNVSPAGRGDKKSHMNPRAAAEEGLGGHGVPRADGCGSPVWLRAQLPTLWFGVTSPACRGREVLGLWLLGLFEESQEKLCCTSWCCGTGRAMGGGWSSQEKRALGFQLSSGFVCDRDQRVEHPRAARSRCKPAGFGTTAPKDTLGHRMSGEEHTSQQQLEGGKNVQITQTRPHVRPQSRFQLLGGCLATTGTGCGEIPGWHGHTAGELPKTQTPQEEQCRGPWRGFTLQGLEVA